LTDTSFYAELYGQLNSQEPNQQKEDIMAKIKFVEVDSTPVCPHCKKQLESIEKTSKGFIERHTVYMCPHCKAVLSIGYNLGA